MSIVEQKDHGLKSLAMEYYEQARKAVEEHKIKECITLLQDAAHLFQVCGDDYMYAKSRNMLGVFYGILGDEHMEAESLLEALECARNKGLHTIMGPVYNNLGSRYQEYGAHRKAIYYFKKALEEENQLEPQEQEGYYGCMSVLNLNLAVSYHKLGDQERSLQYLEQTEHYIQEEERGVFALPVLWLKCTIRWQQGDKEYVSRHLEELLSMVSNLEAVNDYLQNVEELAGLFQLAGEYEYWKRLLVMVEDMAKEQETIYYELVSCEMWMDYYQAVGDMDSYGRHCVEHAKLYHRQKKDENRHKIEFLDLRIALRKKEEERRLAETKSRTDALTTLENRHGLEVEIYRAVHRAVACGRSICLGIVDVDCFKQVNDTYGHNGGDECLRELALILKHVIEGYGKVFRYGGDEFVVLLPEGNSDTTEHLAKRIHRKLAQAKIPNENSDVDEFLTVSQGYACFHPNAEERIIDMLGRADQALYEVKNHGRNGFRVITEET